MIIVLMGVCGSGKTTVGELLAERLGWSFADADIFHPSSNISKMEAGLPLTDEDRKPWLLAIHRYIVRLGDERKNGVVTCSALKENYRQLLVEGESYDCQLTTILNDSNNLIKSAAQPTKESLHSNSTQPTPETCTSAGVCIDTSCHSKPSDCKMCSPACEQSTPSSISEHSTALSASTLSGVSTPCASNMDWSRASGNVLFVFLRGSLELISQRMLARRGHFMPPSLLQSQLETLEEPTNGENALTVDISLSVEEIVNNVVCRVNKCTPF